MSAFFVMNPPNPPHWTLSLCFHKFHCVWVHLLWFRNCMKLGAKQCEQVQLLQKFVPRIHVRICHNEPPNPPHWILNSCLCASRSVWVYLAIFCYYTKLGAKRVEPHINAQVRAMKSHRNFRNEGTRSTPLDYKLMFWCVL